MNKTVALPVVLALLIASPALARTHHQQQTNPGANGSVERTYAPPSYGNEVPWAPF